MDQIDQQIVRILQDDARIPWSELGRQIGLSAPAVIERVRKWRTRESSKDSALS